MIRRRIDMFMGHAESAPGADQKNVESMVRQMKAFGIVPDAVTYEHDDRAFAIAMNVRDAFRNAAEPWSTKPDLACLYDNRHATVLDVTVGRDPAATAEDFGHVLDKSKCVGVPGDDPSAPAAWVESAEAGTWRAFHKAKPIRLTHVIGPK